MFVLRIISLGVFISLYRGVDGIKANVKKLRFSTRIKPKNKRHTVQFQPRGSFMLVRGKIMPDLMMPLIIHNLTNKIQ